MLTLAVTLAIALSTTLHQALNIYPNGIALKTKPPNLIFENSATLTFRDGIAKWQPVTLVSKCE